eukprot:255282-Pyramimonas_sp.AAC.2
MERSAQRLTQTIGYIGAGTVEYLYNAATKSYFFLELNPRLQVEHPVTEGITGVNLPSLQLQVRRRPRPHKTPRAFGHFRSYPERRAWYPIIVDDPLRGSAKINMRPTKSCYAERKERAERMGETEETGRRSLVRTDV